MWSLLGTGNFDSFSQSNEVVQLFKTIGLLHLLVLSGSQVGVLASLYRAILRSLPFLSKFRNTNFYLAESLGRRLLMISYVGGTGFSAPLTRAALAYEAQESTYSLRKWGIVLAVFCIHALVFPGQTGQLSFVLSWASFLMLLVLNKYDLPRWVATGILSILCHSLIVVLKDLDMPTPVLWGKILVSNVVLAWPFNRIIFPMVAFLVLGAIFLSFFVEQKLFYQWGVNFFGMFGFIYNGIGRLVLCAIRAIRYI